MVKAVLKWVIKLGATRRTQAPNQTLKQIKRLNKILASTRPLARRLPWRQVSRNAGRSIRRRP